MLSLNPLTKLQKYRVKQNKKVMQNRLFIFFYCEQKFSGSNLFVVNFKQFFRVFRWEGFPIKAKIGLLILALLQT